MKNKIVFAIIAWIALVVWMGFIYSMSADSGTESSEKSNTVIDIVAEIFVPDYEEMSPEEQEEVRESLSFPIRKLAHITEYCILGVLASVAVWFTPKLEKTVFRLLLPFVIGVGYASFDEYHQSFVPGRGPAFTDVCIDSFGVILGIGLVWGVYALYRVRSAKKLEKVSK